MRYTYLDYPLKVFGIPNFSERKTLQRLPAEICEQVPSLNFLGKRPMGARLCFRTNASNFTINIEFETLKLDKGMSLYAGQAASVFVGERKNARFAGLVCPNNYEEKTCKALIKKSSNMEDVTIYLPRNEILKNIEIDFPDEAIVNEPTAYRYDKPILFYGSSITEGGCGNIANGYNAILSRRLDFDYYNLGFSGSAKGETPLAEYIATLDISVFVFDYDHNAPSLESLEETHYPFYKIIRSAKPYLPILMMTRPQARYTENEIARREIVRKSYERAKQEGDKNVYFLDGELFCSGEDADLCFVDGIHPNDLGFYRMALAIETTLKQILKKL